MTYEFRHELTDLFTRMTYGEQDAWLMYTTRLRAPGRTSPVFMPDFVIAPDGNPYLYRWYLTGNPHEDPRLRRFPSIMFHIQVASDPERPLHDHPWDNVSHIIAGGYLEVVDPEPANQTVDGRKRRETYDPNRVHAADVPSRSLTEFYAIRKEGDIVMRRAQTAHRLILPDGVPYTMSLFTTGPKQKDWGFWYPDGWHHNEEHVALRNGVSVHVNR